MPSRIPLRSLTVGLFLSQASLSQAHASEPAGDSPTLATLSLEELMELPVESVTGVSKYQQDIRRAPAGVTVYTAADIRNYGWTTLSDALRAAPGIHVRSDRFYDFVGMRGFTRPYDYNSRTLILLDGHRLDDTIYQQGPIGSDFILDLDMVDRIEIISGPGSSVYGSNAFYGAVNVIPKTGRDISGAQIGAGVGTEPSGKLRVTVGDRTPDGVDYVVSATEWWSEGESAFPLTPTWAGVADPSGSQGTIAKHQDEMHNQSLFSRVTWRGISGEAAYARRDKEVLPEVYFTPNGADAHGIDERAYLLIRGTGEPTPDSELNAKVSLDLYHYEGLFSPAFNNFEPFAPYADSLSVNTEVSWRQTIADSQSLRVGVEYQENLRQDFGVDLPAAGTPYFEVRESSSYISPFAQLDWEFAPTFRTSLGARYDYYDEETKRLTPRVGLIWDALPSTTLKLLYGEAFRAPNVAERSPGEDYILQNPDIGPETNQSWEFVAEQRFGPVWRLDSHFYYTRSEDLIATVPTGNPGEVTYGNVGNYITKGFDVGPAAYFASGVQVRASATVQRTYDKATDEVVTDAPQTLGKLQVSTPVVKKWLRASVELLYVGDRKDGGGVDGIVRETGDYLNANFTLRASRLWERWDISLSIYNLADDPWSDPKATGQIDSPPRSAMLRAEMDF